MKNKLIRKVLVRLFACVLGFFLSTNAIAQLPTAQTIASNMKLAWNLGNTLEAQCGETAWGAAVTTQRLIDSVKAAGFNTIRLPCAWDCHTSNGVIDPTWLARVKQVVDYCINDNLYVIVNIHWDGGWLENNVTTSAQSSVNAKQNNYWTQIANYFKGYNEHLLFASANEPNASDATGMSVLLSYHQTFVNAVRATGGNNSSRTLIVQGPNTNIGLTNTLMNALPTIKLHAGLWWRDTTMNPLNSVSSHRTPAGGICFTIGVKAIIPPRTPAAMLPTGRNLTWIPILR